MLVEERCYVLHPTYSPADYLKVYRSHGYALQSEILGGLQGYFTTEVGQLNAIVSLWEYESFESRQERRARLASEPGWQDYLEKVRPMIAQMSNRLMLRAI
ncbi:MAG: NIPSNAP protein [Rhodobacteraceae bacterium HLUCCA12]|nr:MAG: NIPSNAP protein [Rhodobacteraceae bacterium HLUCCA12]